MELIIGNKNYSSWSLRAWLCLAAFEVPFRETKLNLFTPEFYTRLEAHTPAAKVPVLIDNGVTVWDSLAICEYLNETCLQGRGWPEDPSERARARSVAAEMHSGYAALRNEMPMNCRAKRRVDLSEAALRDVAAIDQLWCDLLQRDSGAPWLFGEFSIADIFFAPVALRFETYAPELSAPAAAYMQRLLALPAMQQWVEDALQEEEWVEEDEAGQPL
ncbi:glutathione S-transferase family protein [Neptuniibacter halophilus]|uniref:glutathione S-transferase family protein n=1 Tax=Neptuniibacter halophilus TaxID=651666 RepID=UPI0025726BB9|nr:glutathione S-transferase family protein [Neptuniibacter halophilus]